MEYVSVLGYLDAGSGSVLLQALLAGAAGLAITGKLWWGRLLSLLRIRRPQPEPATNSELAADETGPPSRAS